MVTTRTNRRDPLIAELMRDYGFTAERELRARLRDALAWADAHRVQFIESRDDGATGYEVSVGRRVSKFAGRLVSGFFTDEHSWRSAAHRRLLKAAAALFLFTHPVTRKSIETAAWKRKAG